MDRYLHFGYHHPGYVKRRLIRCLLDRAEKVTSDGKQLSKERKHLNRVLYTNGDPKHFVSNAMIRREGNTRDEQE